jgi:ribosomal protein S12 methylthiotransferase accessory factor YcaO
MISIIIKEIVDVSMALAAAMASVIQARVVIAAIDRRATSSTTPPTRHSLAPLVR